MTTAKQDGVWSSAALGFAKKHQVQVDTLSTSIDAKGTEVLSFVKSGLKDLSISRKSLKSVSYTHLTLPTNREV